MTERAGPTRVLVVDDEENLIELVQGYLAGEGYDVLTASDGLSAVALAREAQPDLIVLDLMLPGIDGLEVCRRVRQFSDAYIVMLTARAEEIDKVVGLSVGADDYVTKPFSPRELVLRVHAVLRRRGPFQASSAVVSFDAGRLSIDEERHEVRVDGTLVELTPTEWSLLTTLAGTPGRVFSRAELVNRVRGYEFDGYERTIDSHVKNLRRKVESDPHSPVVVETVLGAGYRLGLARDHG